ncbi:unnamed protein product, partial [Prorocentrum cordatum]
ARCEWDLMEVLRRKGSAHAAEVLRAHRESHVTKADFQRIKDFGMNAVRLPFGHWCLFGPAAGEPYVGPCVEYIDRAVGWAEEVGLQVMLDLHGCPGGESGEAPCGRRQRPHGTWTWRSWRVRQSLEAALRRRYCGRSCVTGLSVCNEPSNEIPLARLLKYYDDACGVVRSSGMAASKVAVVLPCFQRDEETVARDWQAMTGGRHKNICFDVHCYHCFENAFMGMSFAEQLRAVESNAEMLRTYPMVVGEWSLALGCATWNTCGDMAEDDVYTRFAAAQLRAFREASHGFFFWNWTEGPDKEWNYQLARELGLFDGVAPPVPRWNGTGEDPLEQQLHPYDGDARIRYGDAVYLRVFHGRCIDVVGASVAARWPDKDDWQEFAFCPAAPAAPPLKGVGKQVRANDIVRLRAKNGRYLTMAKGAVSAQRSATGRDSEFVLHLKHGGGGLSHRGVIYLQSRDGRRVLGAEEEEETLQGNWNDFGWWQQLVVDKAPAAEQPSPSPAAESPAAQARRGGVAAAPSPAARTPAAKARRRPSTAGLGPTPAGKGSSGKRKAPGAAKSGSPRKRARPAAAATSPSARR